MTRKGNWLYWTNFLNLLLMLSLAVTGVLLKWVLPHGQGQGLGPGGGMGRGMGRGMGGGGGGAGQTTWLALSRHEWGDVHFWIAAALLAGIVVHLLLHLGWIVASTRQTFLGRRSARTAELAANI